MTFFAGARTGRLFLIPSARLSTFRQITDRTASGVRKRKIPAFFGRSAKTPHRIDHKTQINRQDPCHNALEGVLFVPGTRRERWLKPVAPAIIKSIKPFMPENYPRSVRPIPYLGYAFWSFLWVVSASFTSVMSTQSLLLALKLSSADNAAALAGTLNWVIKDGLGQLGGVIYAARMGGEFDSDWKKVRFRAGIVFTAAGAIEIISPSVAGAFLVVASLSNVGKNISWLASTATRAHIHAELGRRDNLGDLTAKTGSQSTLASLVGTGLGVLVSAFLGTSVSAMGTIFIPASIIGLWALSKSNSSVAARSINCERLERAFDHYRLYGSIPSPSQIHENIFLNYKPRIRMEVPYKDSDLETAVYWDKLHGGYVVRKMEDGFVALWYIATPTDYVIVRGYLHALATLWKVDIEDFDLILSKMAGEGWQITKQTIRASSDRSGLLVQLDGKLEDGS